MIFSDFKMATAFRPGGVSSDKNVSLISGPQVSHNSIGVSSCGAYAPSKYASDSPNSLNKTRLSILVTMCHLLYAIIIIVRFLSSVHAVVRHYLDS